MRNALALEVECSSGSFIIPFVLFLEPAVSAGEVYIPQHGIGTQDFFSGSLGGRQKRGTPAGHLRDTWARWLHGGRWHDYRLGPVKTGLNVQERNGVTDRTRTGDNQNHNPQLDLPTA